MRLNNCFRQHHKGILSMSRLRFSVTCALVLLFILNPLFSFVNAQEVVSRKKKANTYYSSQLQADILYLDEVFSPSEADQLVLPYMKAHRELFEGKSVLDIGTGSGIIGLYAAKLGAKKVVATDISKQAIKSVRMNAARLNLSSVVETRLVPKSDISAYAVIKPNESFDVIISNPPFSLDLDSKINSSTIDRGDLGFSILNGLEKHLNAKGRVILLYGSLFYHHVMVKYARYCGYETINYNPVWWSPWEIDAVFNSYLKRLLEYHRLPAGALSFNYKEDNLGDVTVDLSSLKKEDNQEYYYGLIIIKRKNVN